jgi:hypothetical protein
VAVCPICLQLERWKLHCFSAELSDAPKHLVCAVAGVAAFSFTTAEGKEVLPNGVAFVPKELLRGVL